MSFPRARIHRFNDSKSCAPPPGSYDPKFEGKVKGAVIEKTERFTDTKGSSHSSNSAESPANLSLASTGASSKSASMNCLPVFRTPQLPRKVVKQASSAPQTKSKLKFDPTEKKEPRSVKEVNSELYEALLVDRDNKDATIRENEAHIDELYERIRKLEKDLEELKLERDDLIEKYKTECQGRDEDIVAKCQLQSNELNSIKEEMEGTKSRLLKANEKCVVLEKTIADNKTLLEHLEQDKEDLLVQIVHLKTKEEESRLRYEEDIKELDIVCKKLVDEKEGMHAAEDERKAIFEKEIKKLKDDLLSLSDVNTDLDSKMNQKQQMILMLQSELSSAELELEELKSENEKIVKEFKSEKSVMTEKHHSDMEEMRNLLMQLESLLSEERGDRLQEVQSLEQNLMNSSVVRENLEALVSDKQSALSVLNEKHLALDAEYERFCMEQKLVAESHRLEMDELQHKLEELNEARIEENRLIEESEKKIKALNDKCITLESECEKLTMEQNLMSEVHRLELENVQCKYEEDLNRVRAEASEQQKEMEDRLKEVMETTAKEAEDRVKDVNIAAEEKLMTLKNNTEKMMKEFELEITTRLRESEIKVEENLKEAELNVRQALEKANHAEEELRRMTHHRDELRISNMENQLTIVDLQDKIDTLVTELNSNRETYEVDLAHARNEHNITKKQCKKLKIGIANIQASLHALQVRLLESERDVERLTNATQQVEAQKAAVEEQVEILAKELQASRRSMSQLEADTVNQIEDTRKDLLCKLEDFRIKAEKNVAAKEEEILEHRHKIEELSARIFELSETLSAVEETNSEHEREIEALTEKLDHQRDCAKIATQQIATLEASNAIYQHQIQALTAELDYQKDFSQKASDHIATLAAIKSKQEKEICELTSQIEAARDRVSALDGELDGLKNLRSEFKEDFDRYKEEMDCVIQNYKHEIKVKEFDIEHKSKDLNRKTSEIKKATDRIDELISENEKKEEKIVENEHKIEKLTTEVEKLKNSQEMLDVQLKSKLAEREEHFKRLLDEAEAKAALAEDWEKQCKEMELLIGPFREQLEAFDAERQALESRKEAADDEMRELGRRYAEILGHQNHKQKIKHVIKLKEQNYEMKKEIEKLEAQVRAQKRIIEKLKDEQRRKTVLQQHNAASAKGKENLDHNPIQKSPASSSGVKPLRNYR